MSDVRGNNKFFSKAFQRQIELMTSDQKAALDEVVRYLGNLPSDEKISFEDARVIFESALFERVEEQNAQLLERLGRGNDAF